MKNIQSTTANAGPSSISTVQDSMDKALQDNTVGQDVSLTIEIEKSPEMVQSDKVPPKSVTIDDTSTQVSSSDGSGKPASTDGKSTVSGTTFAMDEKESLRPDDSASLRDNQEEENLSTTGSVVAGSRVGSDTGSRAFRDQLREISIMTPQGDAQFNQYPPPAMPNPSIAFGDGSVPAMTAQLSMARGIAPTSGNAAYAPDEKLLEALESHKDRVWVLKTEQDIITFVTNPTETRLFLPPTNSFYRMLAHKMADYYLLGHQPDQTGQAVEVYKTPYTRLAAPLATVQLRSAAPENTPPSMPMRKIMRRGGEKGTPGSNTASNSEGPSMTTSEAGGDSASEAGNDVKKTPLSREDREARYREVRMRIFGTAEETERPASPDAAAEDMSRSSSTTGKKNKKKTRSNTDDGFEARSAYSQFHNSPVPAEGYGADGIYYGPYSTMGSPVMPVYGAYPQLVSADGQQSYMWPQQMYAMPPNMQQLASSTQSGYDLSADFQRGMHSFQTAKATPQQPPAIPSPSMTSMQMQYPMPMQSGPQWLESGFQPNQSQGSYPISQRSTSPSGQSTHPVPYAYGQLPAPAFANGKPLANQHPIPGSFNRQQFNPQSQTFVPGNTSSPQFPVQQPQMISYQSAMPGMRGSTGTPQAYATPPRPPSYNSLTPSTPSSLPKQPMTAASTPPSALPAAMQGQQHPLPQLPNPDSTIAKWGTPSHLPPKPPPPTTMQPQRWLETHQRQMQMQGSTPALNAAAEGVARMSVGTNGAVGRGSSGNSPVGTGSPSSK